MEIKILSRDAIKTKFLPAKTAVISITDYDWSFAKLANKPDYLLQLAFDDIDGDVFMDELGRKPTSEEMQAIEQKYHMLSDEQAKEIADFYHSICDKADLLICQCEHGQSRSAAIAAAIMEYEHCNGIHIFASDDYYPNKIIFRKVLKAIAR